MTIHVAGGNSPDVHAAILTADCDGRAPSLDTLAALNAHVEREGHTLRVIDSVTERLRSICDVDGRDYGRLTVWLADADDVDSDPWDDAASDMLDALDIVETVNGTLSADNLLTYVLRQWAERSALERARARLWQSVQP